MRLKHIHDALEKLQKSNYLIENKQPFYFENRNPLFLEIGMGKGIFILENALKFPQNNYIGIEKYPSVQYLVLHKIASKLKPNETFLPNLKLLSEDASKLNEWFEKDSVNGIYLNFSDPWPKTRHSKRRLTYKDFLKIYFDILKLDGFIEIKTDQKDLYNFTLEQLEQQNHFVLVETSLDLHAFKSNIISTEYEKRFISENKPIYFIKLVKT